MRILNWIVSIVKAHRIAHEQLKLKPRKPQSSCTIVRNYFKLEVLWNYIKFGSEQIEETPRPLAKSLLVAVCQCVVYMHRSINFRGSKAHIKCFGLEPRGAWKTVEFHAFSDICGDTPKKAQYRQRRTTRLMTWETRIKVLPTTSNLALSIASTVDKFLVLLTFWCRSVLIERPNFIWDILQLDN